MIRLVYRDEDGIQEIKFPNQEECDKFINHNMERIKIFHNEKFQVIAIENISNDE